MQTKEGTKAAVWLTTGTQVDFRADRGISAAARKERERETSRRRRLRGNKIRIQTENIVKIKHL